MRGTYYSGAIALVVAVGCSSSTSPSATDGGTSTDGSTSADASTAIKRAINGDCPSSTSTCTQAEFDAHISCATTQCDAEYQECLGPNYKNRTFGGKCATLIACVTACICGDDACEQACGAPQGDCMTCIVTASQCTSSKCTIPKCMQMDVNGTDGGAPKTCADLKACCDSTADSAKKAGCDAVYNAVKGFGDIACNANYQSLVAQGICH